MAKVRVLVVDDSITVRRRLCRALLDDPDVDVVAEATDGETAVELCDRMRPDVVTMDIVLPGMSGVAATEHIMADCPTPILVVSSAVNRGEHFETCDALAAGAVDVLDKPTEGSDHDWERRLRSSVKLVSRIRVITHHRARMGGIGSVRPTGGGPGAGVTHGGAGPSSGSPALPGAPVPSGWPGSPARPCEVVGVGASTGGPQAIAAVLGALPARFQVPVLLVLHINEPFGSAFAEWLAGRLGRRVRFPAEGEPVAATAGQVIMAPPDRHLEVRQGRLHLHQGPERNSCRPSVDVLFESLAAGYGRAAAGCLLTGMGRDGADGLLAIRRTGGRTVAQDEATSVVYGMPREAVARGAAQLVLPLDRIGPALSEVDHLCRGVAS